ncbi:MAG: hypothetical protein GX096_09750 [Clostridiales bacterium]|nr:hypothetical protein [Clostridiales bacterium]
MKKFHPILVLVCAVAIAAGGMLLLGNLGLPKEDYNPSYTQTGELLRFLRDGETFRLSDAFTQEWDSVQFAAATENLQPMEQQELYQHDAGFTAIGENDALMVLWRKDQIALMLPLPRQRDGYPRFLDATGNDTFEISRENAQFLCTFVPSEDGGSGYYECSVAGEQL